MENTAVVLETVIWDDVYVPRTRFSVSEADSSFEIPAQLYKRWEDATTEFWAVQHELRAYKTGEKIA